MDSALLEKIEEYDHKLLATDTRFKGTVIVLHEEGTTLIFRYAFVMRYHEWFIIFTEHHKWHAYHADDAQVLGFGEPVEPDDLR